MLLPGAMNELNVGRPVSVAALRYAAEHEALVLVLLQHDSTIDAPAARELHQVGTLCRITTAQRTSPEAACVGVIGEQRVRVVSIERSGDGLFAEVEPLTWKPAEPAIPDELRATLPFLIDIGLGQLGPMSIRSDLDRLGYLSVVAPMTAKELQQVLETEDLQPVVQALRSLRDENWFARFLRWLRSDR